MVKFILFLRNEGTLVFLRTITGKPVCSSYLSGDQSQVEVTSVLDPKASARRKQRVHLLFQNAISTVEFLL